MSFQPNKNNSSTIALDIALKTHPDQNKFPTIKINKPNSQQTKRINHASISLQTKNSLPNNSNSSPKKVWPLGFGKKRLLYLIQEEQSKKEMERKKEDQQKQKEKQNQNQNQNQTNGNNQQLPNSTKKQIYSMPNNQLPTTQPKKNPKISATKTTTHNIQVQKQNHQNHQLNNYQQQKQPPVQTQINKLFNKKKPYLTNYSNQNLKNPQIFSGIQDNTTKLDYSKNLLTNLPNPILFNNLASTTQQISANGDLTNNNLPLPKHFNTQVIDSVTISNPKTRRTASPNNHLPTLQPKKNPKTTTNKILLTQSKATTKTKTTTTTPTPTPTTTKTNFKIESKHNYGSNLPKIDLHSTKIIQRNWTNLKKENQLNDNLFPIQQNSFLIKNQNNNLNNTDSKRTNGIKVKMTNENDQNSIQTEINNHKQQKNNTNLNFNNLSEKKFAFEKTQGVEMDMYMDTSTDMGKNTNNNINVTKKHNKHQIIIPNKKTNGQVLAFEKSKDQNKIIKNKFDDNVENNDGNDKNNNLNIILNNSNEFWNLEKDLNERTKKNKSVERYSNNNKISQTFTNKNEDYTNNKIENTKPNKTSKSFEQRVNNNNKNLNKVSLKNLQETSKNENVNENEIEIIKQNENEKNKLTMRKNEYNHRGVQGEEDQTQKKSKVKKSSKKVIKESQQI